MTTPPKITRFGNVYQLQLEDENGALIQVCQRKIPEFGISLTDLTSEINNVIQIDRPPGSTWYVVAKDSPGFVTIGGPRQGFIESDLRIIMGK